KPHVTCVSPDGVIDPFEPAIELIAEGGFSVKLAVIVWPAWTPVNVYVLTAPTETPSTTTSAIVSQPSGVMVNAWSEPQPGLTVPDGVIVPPVPAVATMLVLPPPNVAAIVWLPWTCVNV